MQPGDRIKLTTVSEEIEGTLMPEQQGYFVIKLDSGYNIAYKKRSIAHVELISSMQQKKEEKKTIEQKQGLPKITILHTGGTIASKVDYETGGVIARFSPQEILEMFPELKEISVIDSKFIRNMWSEDMKFDHYNLLAEETSKALQKSEGVIITHGTDTMHYTAAALSFILQKLGKPVILVGAQRSSDRPSSDAFLNVLSAAQVITQTKFAGVAICMHENADDDVCILLPGTQTRKMHSSRRDAFRPINAKPIARIRTSAKSITFTSECSKKTNEIPKVFLIKNIKVGMLVSYPGLTPEEILQYDGWDGLIVQGTGLGHAPINNIDDFTIDNEKIFEAIKKVAKKTVIVMATQTIFGETNMNVYSTGRKLQEAGVIGANHRITPETAYIKLAWLLSNYPKEKAKELFTTNMAGENPERI